MQPNKEQSIADSLETNLKLLPHIPYLLQDLWELGSSVESILQLMETLGKSGNKRILDLGCGKGALSVRIADKYRFRVDGIDLMNSFLEDARLKASAYKVSDLCTFLNYDIRTFTQNDHDYDAVILASLGGVLGSLKFTVQVLRNQIRPGGLIIIDDGYLRNRKHFSRKGYEHYKDHESTISELTVFGDIMVKEVNTTKLSAKINKEYLDIIKSRGEELVLKHPRIKEEIKSYIDLQTEECDVLNNYIEGAVWLLQRVS
jgi:cyclopropane fatty-acyl-phospholipid synthase-like methyltransferase